MRTHRHARSLEFAVGALLTAAVPAFAVPNAAFLLAAQPGATSVSKERFDALMQAIAHPAETQPPPASLDRLRLRELAAAYLRDPKDETFSVLVSAVKDPCPGASAPIRAMPVPAIGRPDEAFLITDLTVDGLEKAGLKMDDLADIAVELEERAQAWGRPLHKAIKLGQLSTPISPLCLYAPELQRLSSAIVERIKSKGFVGIQIRFDEPRHPADGRLRLSLFLARIGELRVVDNRPAPPPADSDRVKNECPLKVGGHIMKPVLDAYVQQLIERYDSEVHVAIMPGDDPEQPESLIVTIYLGPIMPPE